MEFANEGYLVARLLAGDNVAVDAEEPEPEPEPVFPNALVDERRGRGRGKDVEVPSGVVEDAPCESATERDDDLSSSENVRDGCLSSSETSFPCPCPCPLADEEASSTGLSSGDFSFFEYLWDVLPLLGDCGGGWGCVGSWGSGGWEGCCADSCE